MVRGCPAGRSPRRPTGTSAWIKIGGVLQAPRLRRDVDRQPDARNFQGHQCHRAVDPNGACTRSTATPATAAPDRQRHAHRARSSGQQHRVPRDGNQYVRAVEAPQPTRASMQTRNDNNAVYSFNINPYTVAPGVTPAARCRSGALLQRAVRSQDLSAMCRPSEPVFDASPGAAGRLLCRHDRSFIIGFDRALRTIVRPRPEYATDAGDRCRARLTHARGTAAHITHARQSTRAGYARGRCTAQAWSHSIRTSAPASRGRRAGGRAPRVDAGAPARSRRPPLAAQSINFLRRLVFIGTLAGLINDTVTWASSWRPSGRSRHLTGHLEQHPFGTKNRAIVEQMRDDEAPSTARWRSKPAASPAHPVRFAIRATAA